MFNLNITILNKKIINDIDKYLFYKVSKGMTRDIFDQLYFVAWDKMYHPIIDNIRDNVHDQMVDYVEVVEIY